MSRVFRPAALDQLFLIEEGLVRSLLQDYRSTTPALIQSIAQSQRLQDFKSLSIHAHSLRSSSKALGFEIMADLCEQVERAAQTKAPLPDLSADLARHMVEALAELEAFLSNRGL